MRSNPTLRRRLSYGVLSAGLLAAGIVPLTASAAGPACPTYVDPKGDAAPDPALRGPLQDEGLDILAITHSTSGGVISSTVNTVKLRESGSDRSLGDWFEVAFTANDKAVVMRVVRDARAARTTTTRLTVNGTTSDVVPVAVYDFKAATVTLTVKQAELEKAVGGPLAGKPFSKLSARSLGNYGPVGYTFDRATAPEGATYLVGGTCKAGAAPKAGATPAPTGSPTAAASPSVSPSGSASPSRSAAPSASASPTAPPPPPQPAVPVPAAGCFGFEDPKGDGRPGGSASPGNDPDLDILAVTGRTTPTTLSGHLQIDRLRERPSFPAFTGHRFEYQFTVGDDVVVLRANGPGEGTGLVNGATNDALKVTAAFDLPSSQVVLSVDRKSLVNVLTRQVPDGSVLLDQVGRSAARTPAPVLAPADTASTDNEARSRYTVGDNTCFAPKLSLSLPAQVQTSDRALVSVVVTTSDGRTAPRQTVTARVGDGRAVSATADGQGAANLVVPVTEPAGLQQLVVRSTGSAGKGELRSDIEVVVERTVLALRSAGRGTTRTVTATLTDDDAVRRALPGQRLAFAFAGRTVTATTDRAGRAVVSVPAGSAVDVAFAGRRGFLTPSRARTTAR